MGITLATFCSDSEWVERHAPRGYDSYGTQPRGAIIFSLPALIQQRRPAMSSTLCMSVSSSLRHAAALR